MQTARSLEHSLKGICSCSRGAHNLGHRAFDDILVDRARTNRRPPQTTLMGYVVANGFRLGHWEVFLLHLILLAFALQRTYFDQTYIHGREGQIIPA